MHEKIWVWENFFPNLSPFMVIVCWIWYIFFAEWLCIFLDYVTGCNVFGKLPVFPFEKYVDK